MATQNIKKTTIPLSSMGLLNMDSSGNLMYSVRYRIVSEDASRYSAWTPVYDISYTKPTHDYGVSKSTGQGSNIVLSWDSSVLAAIPQFDIYTTTETTVSSSTVWTYLASVPNSGNQSSFTYVPPQSSPIKHMAVQIGTNKKECKTTYGAYLGDVAV